MNATSKNDKTRIESRPVKKPAPTPIRIIRKNDSTKDVRDVKISTNGHGEFNNGPKKPFKSVGDKPKPKFSNNKKPMGKKPMNNNGKKPPMKVVSKIKKKHSLKPVELETMSDKRMYRLSFIFGSTVICDTFVVNGMFLTSIVEFRDKLLASWMDLSKLLDKNVISNMLPSLYLKIKDTSMEGILKGKNNDIVHSLTKDIYSPIENTENENALEFPSIVSYTIKPGKTVSGISKRVAVRLNYIQNANFALKKAPKSK